MLRRSSSGPYPGRLLRCFTLLFWLCSFSIPCWASDDCLSHLRQLGKKFWWGISTSAYQTEDSGGKAFWTDWDLFIQKGYAKHLKGYGAYSYTHIERDIAALKTLGATHYRFGIEWARIEPQPGRFQADAIEHYVKLAKRLREEGIVPIACLWHFTFPEWLSSIEHPELHGWLNPKTQEHWIRYVRVMAEALKPFVEYWAPENEPNTQALLGYVAGIWPPGSHLRWSLYRANTENAAEAFRRAAHLIRKTNPTAKIISIQAVNDWAKSKLDPFSRWLKRMDDFSYYHLDLIANELDILGFDYYMRETASPLAGIAQKIRRGKDVSDLGWPISPEGLGNVIRDLSSRYGKPLIIMENGVADATDKKRIYLLNSHIAVVDSAVASGIPLNGYFHWT